MINLEYEINFFHELAEEIKPQGFRCFLYNEGHSAWMYIITPNNSWLHIYNAEDGGFNIIYEYESSREFGSGCCYNETSLYEITSDILLKAEQYGKHYGHYSWIDVPNTYDGKSHRENTWRTPNHYTDAYKSMMKSWCASKLKEL